MHWFGSALKMSEAIATSDLPVADEVKKVIAADFRGLWGNTELCDYLDRIARGFACKGFWREGWIAARQTIAYDAKHLSPESLTRLKALEEFLRPKDLVAKVRGIVLEARGRGLDYDDIDDIETYDYEASEKRTAAAIEQLGRDVVADTNSFNEILPELLSGGGRLGPFGQALALGTDKPRDIWDALVRQLAANPNGNPHVMGGFVTGLQKTKSDDADVILDDALVNPTLATWFPYLQAGATIDDKGVARLHRSLELGNAPMDRYSVLAWGRAADPLPGAAFRDLVIAIAEKGGIDAALHIVSMRLVSDRADKRPPLPETIEAGRRLLSMFEFGNSKRQAQREDHELGSLAKVCLVGKGGEEIARRLMRMLKEASADYRQSASDYDDLVKALFAVHPLAMLDEMFTGDAKSVTATIRFIEALARRRASPLDGVAPNTLIAWCTLDPPARFPVAAAVGVLFKGSSSAPLQWTALASLLLKSAPDAKAMLLLIVQRLYFNSWSGSWATKMEGRSKLLEQLDVGDDVELRTAKAEALVRIKSQIEESRRREAEEDRQRSARFE